MKNIIKLILALFMVLSFTSCLKDDELIGPDADGAKGNLIEFFNLTTPISSTSAPYVLYVPKTLEVVPETDFQIAISYSGAEKAAPEDITVNLEVAPDAVTKYNESQSSNYVQMAQSGYEFPTSVTIKKGEKKAYITVKIKPEELDQSVSNVLALRISSASHGIISGNFGTAIFSLPIKSMWEGTYNYSIINPTEGNKTSTSKKLSTVGPNLVETPLLFHHYSGYTQYQFSGDNTTIIGMNSYSGAVFPVTNLQVVEVDVVNRIFEVKWTVLGRNVTERYERIGD